MTASTVVRLLADPDRLRAFAALVLGARTPADVASASGLSARQVAAALRRLQDGELVDAELQVREERFRELARDTDPAPVDPLRPFVQGERLHSVPASPARRRVVLEHVVSRAFVPGVTFTEREVNDRLGAWCSGGEVDHVTIRRYLVDLGLLVRAEGLYRVAPDHAEQPVL